LVAAAKVEAVKIVDQAKAAAAEINRAAAQRQAEIEQAIAARQAAAKEEAAAAEEHMVSLRKDIEDLTLARDSLRRDIDNVKAKLFGETSAV
jgi:hypothetical protein